MFLFSLFRISTISLIVFCSFISLSIIRASRDMFCSFSCFCFVFIMNVYSPWFVFSCFYFVLLLESRNSFFRGVLLILWRCLFFLFLGYFLGILGFLLFFLGIRRRYVLLWLFCLVLLVVWFFLLSLLERSLGMWIYLFLYHLLRVLLWVLIFLRWVLLLCCFLLLLLLVCNLDLICMGFQHLLLLLCFYLVLKVN